MMEENWEIHSGELAQRRASQLFAFGMRSDTFQGLRCDVLAQSWDWRFANREYV